MRLRVCNDTHTALLWILRKYVIFTGDSTPTVVSTASPFKFNIAYEHIRNKTEGLNEFELLNMLSEKTGWDIPKGLKDLDKKQILHRTVCEKNEMSKTMRKMLNLND